MKLKVLGDLKGKPLTKLSRSQQERFIKQFTNANHSNDYQFGIEIALLILGYEIVKPE